MGSIEGLLKRGEGVKGEEKEVKVNVGYKELMWK